MLTDILKETLKNAKIREKMNMGELRPLNRKDILNPYFLKWLFSLYEFSEDEPEKFNFDILVYDKDRYAYGYFIKDKLEAFFVITTTKKKGILLISMLFINPKYQNKGIGQEIFKHILNKWNDYDLMLEVFADNKRALHIYEKYGFKIIDNRIVTPEENGEGSMFVGKKLYIMKRKRKAV